MIVCYIQFRNTIILGASFGDRKELFGYIQYTFTWL